MTLSGSERFMHTNNSTFRDSPKHRINISTMSNLVSSKRLSGERHLIALPSQSKDHWKIPNDITILKSIQ